MRTIYEFGEGGYATGKTAEIADEDGVISNWTRTPPPELVGGEFAVWQGGRWAITGIPYSPPPPPVPSSCSRRQGRLALLEHGLLDDVEAAIAAIADPIDRRKAQVEYEADTWERSNPFLVGMWAKLGGDEAGLDDLFRLAVTL